MEISCRVVITRESVACSAVGLLVLFMLKKKKKRKKPCCTRVRFSALALTRGGGAVEIRTQRLTNALPALKTGIGQNIATHASPTAGRNFFLNFRLRHVPVHSPSFLFCFVFPPPPLRSLPMSVTLVLAAKARSVLTGRMFVRRTYLGQFDEL